MAKTQYIIDPFSAGITPDLTTTSLLKNNNA